MARKRTTLEVEPIVLKAIKLIARRRKLKVKYVSDVCLRYAIPYEDVLFALPKNNKRNKDNGK